MRDGKQKPEVMHQRDSPLADVAEQGRFGANKGAPGVDLSVRHPASIVAIVRNEEVLASPGPGEMLRAQDVLIVIGTEDGIAAVEQIIDKG